MVYGNSSRNILGSAERLDWSFKDIAAADQSLDRAEPFVSETAPGAVEQVCLSPVAFLITMAATIISPHMACWSDTFLSNLRAGGVKATMVTMAARWLPEAAFAVEARKRATARVRDVPKILKIS